MRLLVVRSSVARIVGAHGSHRTLPRHVRTCGVCVCGMWLYMIRVCCTLVNLELAPLIFRGNSCRPRVLARRAASATSAMGGAAGVRRHPGGRPSVVVESGSCLSLLAVASSSLPWRVPNWSSSPQSHVAPNIMQV